MTCYIRSLWHHRFTGGHHQPQPSSNPFFFSSSSSKFEEFSTQVLSLFLLSINRWREEEWWKDSVWWLFNLPSCLASNINISLNYLHSADLHSVNLNEPSYASIHLAGCMQMLTLRAHVAVKQPIYVRATSHQTPDGNSRVTGMNFDENEGFCVASLSITLNSI